MTTRWGFPILAGALFLMLLPTGGQAQRLSTWGATTNSSLSSVGSSMRLATVNLGVDRLGAPMAQNAAFGPRSGATLAFGGLVGGVLGSMAGGLSSVAVCGCNTVEGYDALEAFFWGAAVSTAITIPLGVHAANRLKGNYGTALAASVGISAIGLAAAFAADEPAIILLIPVSQIVSSVLIERRTTGKSSSAR